MRRWICELNKCSFAGSVLACALPPARPSVSAGGASPEASCPTPSLTLQLIHSGAFILVGYPDLVLLPGDCERERICDEADILLETLIIYAPAAKLMNDRGKSWVLRI